MVIRSIDVANYGTAFIEILARNSEWDKERPYVPLVPMTNLMTPTNSRNWVELQGVTLFGASELGLESISSVLNLRLLSFLPISRRPREI